MRIKLFFWYFKKSSNTLCMCVCFLRGFIKIMHFMSFLGETFENFYGFFYIDNIFFKKKKKTIHQSTGSSRAGAHTHTFFLMDLLIDRLIDWLMMATNTHTQFDDNLLNNQSIDLSINLKMYCCYH